jgi:hypothetical protein
MPPEGGAVREVRLCARGGMHLHLVVFNGRGKISGRWWGAGARRVVKKSAGSVRG